MREIKFRAKRKDDGSWVEGYLAGPKLIAVTGGEAYEYKPSVQVVPETIGQFTGICDANGKKIFEGDVVRYRWTDDRYKKNPGYKTGVVVWDEFYGCWGLSNWLRCVFRPERLKVIGNIHDNPDLTVS